MRTPGETGRFRCAVCRGGAAVSRGNYEDWLAVAGAAADERQTLIRFVETDPALRWRSVLQCAGCGFIRIEPLPGVAALENFYQSYYGSDSYSAKAASKIKRAEKRIRRVQRRGTAGTFLDVGCNLGFAVEAARRLGFSASGIDIDAAAIRGAQSRFPGGRFVCAPVEQIVETGERFDLLYCSEVIEHLTDAPSFVAALARLAKPGGRLLLTTPDAGHFRVPRNFLAWPEAKPPEHLVWFSKSCLRLLSERHGFDVESFALNLKPRITMIARRV